MIKNVLLKCLCDRGNLVSMSGNNNADGKAICKCGRHITIHLRRQTQKERKEEVND